MSSVNVSLYEEDNFKYFSTTRTILLGKEATFFEYRKNGQLLVNNKRYAKFKIQGPDIYFESKYSPNYFFDFNKKYLISNISKNYCRLECRLKNQKSIIKFQYILFRTDLPDEESE